MLRRLMCLSKNMRNLVSAVHSRSTCCHMCSFSLKGSLPKGFQELDLEIGVSKLLKAATQVGKNTGRSIRLVQIIVNTIAR